MYMGVALDRQNEVDTLLNVPGLTIASAEHEYWNNAAFWVYEANSRTMSMDDISAYNPFLHWNSSDEVDLYSDPYEKHMRPEHFDAFERLWHAPMPQDDRRFKRLPGKKTNQVKQALLEREGAHNLPDDCVPTPVLEERR